MTSIPSDTPTLGFPKRGFRRPRNSRGFSDETEEAKRLKALHLAEVISYRDQLLEEGNISKEAIEREQQEYEKGLAERQRQEEEDYKFSQWLQEQEQKSANSFCGEIPEDVKTFLKILRINRELTPQEYARLNLYYEE